MTETTKKTRSIDDKYKNAAEEAVQEQMRIDKFAPSVLSAIESDVDLRNGVKKLVAEAIEEKKAVQKAINEVVDQNRTNKIYKIIVTVAIVLGTALITSFGTWIVARVLPGDDSKINELQKQIEELQQDS